MMTGKERAKLTLVRDAIDGVHTVAKVAVKPGVSKRRVKQLKRNVSERGDGAVIHGNSGRNPANATDEVLATWIMALKKSRKYEKANFTHLQELPGKVENIKISYTCLRTLLDKDTPEFW